MRLSPVSKAPGAHHSAAMRASGIGRCGAVRCAGQAAADARESSGRKGHAAMLSKLKDFFSRLSGEGAAGPEAAAAEVEYKGYLIRPTPYKNNGQYQTSGTIRKETPEG
ncbi:MAG TPA: HlyU family transcriptional regulator, partial [Hyphomicrobiaceae bacterium]